MCVCAWLKLIEWFNRGLLNWGCGGINENNDDELLLYYTVLHTHTHTHNTLLVWKKKERKHSVGLNKRLGGWSVSAAAVIITSSRFESSLMKDHIEEGSRDGRGGCEQKHQSLWIRPGVIILSTDRMEKKKRSYYRMGHPLPPLTTLLICCVLYCWCNMHVPVRIGVTSKDEMALPLIISDWANSDWAVNTHTQVRKRRRKRKNLWPSWEMKQLAQHQKKKKRVSLSIVPPTARMNKQLLIKQKEQDLFMARLSNAIRRPSYPIAPKPTNRFSSLYFFFVFSFCRMAEQCVC